MSRGARGHLSVLRLLHRRIVDMIAADQNGTTPAIIAVAGGRPRCVLSNEPMASVARPVPFLSNMLVGWPPHLAAARSPDASGRGWLARDRGCHHESASTAAIQLLLWKGSWATPHAAATTCTFDARASAPRRREMRRHRM